VVSCHRYALICLLLACAPAAKPVDRFIELYFQKHGITPPEPVSDRVFVRRVYLDLWGLLPTPEQLTESGQEKRELLIDRLLANRRNYSEHWISFWNDLLRNDEGVVYHGSRQSITAWLLKALEDNLPYDQFVSALVNPVQKSDPAGFLIGVNWRGDVSASQIPAMQAAQNSAQVFLGVNLKCNSCHDSFISRWKLKDAYGLASLFSEQPLDIYRCDVKTGEKSVPQFLYPELGAVPADAAMGERRAAAARLFTTPENRRFARTFVNRVWRRLFGRGLVATLDDMDRPAWDPDLLDWLAADFIDHHYDIQFLLKRIMTSRAYQLPAVATPSKSGDYVFRGPLLRRMTAEQFVDAISSVTGEWRVLQPRQAGAGTYSRDWRLKSSPLTRALGRPIRDQVFTDRNTEATTLQALEVVNGETMARLLRRGAKRMLGELKPSPTPLFDSGVVSSNPATVDIDASGGKKLWLLLEDADSYDPTRVIAGWSPVGQAFLPVQQTIHFKGRAPQPALVQPVPSQTIIDLEGKGYTRLQALVGIDEKCLASDISPRVRFFIFSEEPDRDLLVRVAGDPPVPAQRAKFTLEGLYRYALARSPSPQERRIAQEFLASKPASDGLEDLLWSIFLSPEFQYIQ
jgi:hypothetical protein